MDAIKRASYASKQVRAGPAPLASFEDLPSDELESPEEVTHVPIQSSMFEETLSSQDPDFTTPDSLTISLQSTPRIDSDMDSQFTLTPGDFSDDPSTSEIKSTSLSSLSKPATLNVKQKGSALSLGTYTEIPETEYNQRKSSWTGIFRTGNQSCAKSSISLTTNLESVSEKSSRKKSRDIPKKDGAESKHKEKHKFLSIFKKKSRSTSCPHSPVELIVPPEATDVSETNGNFQEEIILPKNSNNVDISRGKENESPEVSSGKNIINGKQRVSPKITNRNLSHVMVSELPKEIELITVAETQNDLGKLDSEPKTKIPDERKINRKVINNISESSFVKEYNILSQQTEEKQLQKVSTTENIVAIAEEIHESSDSELVFEEKVVKEEKDSDEIKIEEENLIAYDLSEIEEDTITDMPSVTFEGPKQVFMLSRQQRLEVTTKPIERPRSTTPINVAPLEAFIQSVSPSLNLGGNKIKLSLPGEQFLGRVKSPKKPSIRSWADFCESGLHSPRFIQRTDSEEKCDPFGDSVSKPTEVFYTMTQSSWAAFETNLGSAASSNAVPESSSDENHETISAHESFDAYQPFTTSFTIKCSCVCHAYGCATCDDSFKRNGSLQTDENSRKDVETSRICLCKCHTEGNSLNDNERNSLNFLSSNCENAFDSTEEND